MAYTWIQAAAILGFMVHFSGPSGYEIDTSRLSELEKKHLVSVC
jgi:ornithine carbamoyltransferase